MMAILDGQTVWDCVDAAKKHIDRDPSLAVYMVRDMRIVEEAGLRDLAWALADNGANTTPDEARGFFEALDKGRPQ